ncbi:MAG TPA: Rrf2 family transcriptional regulator [Candidatus Cloacimonadota bacterium]|nr:Rrf2 family transcriptional regulator [Candidatus Cloacimonadota bacterium]HQL15559.1 Rrf2 family transcriptional regulator [Candidatus Cloacimonadota bacterium]
MQISTRTEYALRALLEMAQAKNEPISAREICERRHLPRKYIERLLGNLRSAGLIESVPGAKGGYILAQKPEEITLLHIMQAVEDHSWEMSCNSNPPEHCDGKECGLYLVWGDIYQNMRSVLGGYSLDKIEEMTEMNNKGGSE